MKQLTGDAAPCAHLCYCERAANRAENARLRAALQWIADQVDNEDGDLDDIILCANKALTLEQRETAPAATSKPGTCVDGEPNTCTQPFNWDDGVPYCDTCGLYRQSVHHKR